MNLSGYWTGTFEGTNLGGISVSIDQSGDTIGGIATMQEPTLGVLYKYVIDGQIKPTIKIHMKPLSKYPHVIFGSINSDCELIDINTMLGKWQSSVGTQGIFKIRRYDGQGSGDALKKLCKNIFISYSHKDEIFYRDLLVHLKPLEKKGLIDAWSDQRIKAGSLWKKEITTALAGTHAAILLISPDFLASDFIIDNELPLLLSRAEENGVRILPLILRACRFTRDPNLGKFQAINNPDKEILAALQPWECDKIYDRISQEIEALFSLASN